MMAESAKAAFDSPDWIFEIKLDGYRAITVFDAAGKPHLWSRNALPLEAKFPAIAHAVSKLKLRSTILVWVQPKLICEVEYTELIDARLPAAAAMRRPRTCRRRPMLNFDPKM